MRVGKREEPHLCIVGDMIQEQAGEFDLLQPESRSLPLLSSVHFVYLEEPKRAHFEPASDFVQTFLSEFDNFKKQESAG